MEDSTNLSDRADRRPTNPIQQTIQRDTPDVIDPEVGITNPYSPRMGYGPRWAQPLWSHQRTTRLLMKPVG